MAETNGARQGGVLSVSVISAIISAMVTGGGLFFYAGQRDGDIEAIDRRYVERVAIVDRQLAQLFQNDRVRADASSANAAAIQSIQATISNMLAERTRAWTEADRRDAALSARIDKLEAERVAIGREISNLGGQLTQIMDMLRRLLDRDRAEPRSPTSDRLARDRPLP